MSEGSYIASGPDRPEIASTRQYLGETITPPTQPAQNVIRPIMIRQLNHGYTVEVGCQTFAIESASTLIAKLSEYILNPSETERKWIEERKF